MGGAARIGALHVMLGLDSAEFTAGLAKAQNGLGKFSKLAGAGLAVVAAAAATAATSLAVLVKGAIDNADEMSKAAQSVGVTAEALSRLNYAAGLSDVSLEKLSTGLSRLTAGLSQIAQGAGGQAKMAMDALGVSALTSSGQLRGSNEVFADVAEKFSKMEDGATKTALAIALFGKFGAELIPMLNMGKSGLADLAAEADRLGITLDTNTGRAAELFNDSITRMQAKFQGLINQIMTGVVPGLAALADSLANDTTNFGGLQMAVDASIWLFKQFLQFIAEAKANLDALGATMFSVGRAMEALKQGDPGAAWNTLAQTGLETDQIFKDLKVTIDEIWNGTGDASGGDRPDFTPIIPDTASITAATGALKQLAAEGKAVFEATRTPAEAYGLEIERLNKLLQQGAINQDTYNRAVKQAQDAFQNAETSGNQLATTLSDGLSNVFGAVVKGSNGAVDAVESLIQALAKMAITKGIEMLFGAAFGGGFGTIGKGGIGIPSGGFTPGLTGPRLPSFDGGGTTGSGGRVGGLDGRGGFMAMLHPDETVLDHTRGQGAGGGLTVQIDARGAQVGVAEQLDQWARFKLPALVNSINNDPLARG